MRYLVVIEKTGENYSAYIPDIPGCVATGKTKENARQNIIEALDLHLEGLIEDGQPIPKPSSEADYVIAN